MTDRALKFSGIFAGIFGIISLFISVCVLTDSFGLRAIEGNNVFFVVYINFFSSFVYLFSSYGFFKKSKWTTSILFITAGVLFLSYFGLIFYLQSGRRIEMTLLKVMMARVALTIIFAGLSWYFITRTKLDYASI